MTEPSTDQYQPSTSNQGKSSIHTSQTHEDYQASIDPEDSDELSASGYCTAPEEPEDLNNSSKNTIPSHTPQTVGLGDLEDLVRSRSHTTPSPIAGLGDPDDEEPHRQSIDSPEPPEASTRPVFQTTINSPVLEPAPQEIFVSQLYPGMSPSNKRTRGCSTAKWSLSRPNGYNNEGLMLVIEPLCRLSMFLFSFSNFCASIFLAAVWLDEDVISELWEPIVVMMLCVFTFCYVMISTAWKALSVGYFWILIGLEVFLWLLWIIPTGSMARKQTLYDDSISDWTGLSVNAASQDKALVAAVEWIRAMTYATEMAFAVLLFFRALDGWRWKSCKRPRGG